MTLVTKNSVNPCKSVSKKSLCDLCVLGGLNCIFSSVAMRYICRETFTNPSFFEKTNPILAVFGPNTAIMPKNEPKQTQFKPNQTQFITA